MYKGVQTKPQQNIKLLIDHACWDQFKVKQLAVLEERSSTKTAKLKLKKHEQSFNRVSKVKTILVKPWTQPVASQIETR